MNLRDDERTQPTRAGNETTRPPDGQGQTGELDVPELVRLLEEYLANLEAGRPTDRARLVADYPELAPRLGEALAGLDFIHRTSRSPTTTPVRLGDFRIVREVGRGGMGVVYEAEQISLKRRVALKVLRIGGVADQLALQRFQREAETVAGLHHTNIVPIFAIGCEEGIRYYAMQFVEGRDLASLAAEARAGYRQTAPEHVGRWGLQAAEALAHAHHHGVIHRDIKPSNLILDSNQRIWLTDFGLARRMDDASLSLTGALLGTPRYMSPEQAGAATRPVDHRTDIYSLGATLYELAAGRPLFEAETAHEILHRILHQEPLALRQVAANIPRDLETIILKCLAKDPAQRYPTAQQLADDLRAFVEGRSIRARRPSAAERTLRWARKHRRTTTVAAWTACASVLLLVTGLLGFRFHRQAQLGYLTLTTPDPHLQAEIYHTHHDQIAVPAFSLPTRQPLPLPAGSYRVHLSSPSLPGEDLLLDLSRRAQPSFEVSLAHRILSPALDLNGLDRPELIALDGTADWILARRWGMRRIDAATGTELWKLDLLPGKFKNLLKDIGEQQAWDFVLDHRPQGRPPALLRPAPDLDADTVGDLVWAGDAAPAMLAVSGRTGHLLWWHPGNPPDATNHAGPNGPYQAWWGSVAGPPATLPIDEHPAPDLVALFSSGNRKWVEAISGHNGKILWRRALDAAWFQKPAWSSRELLFSPRLARIRSRTNLIVCASTQVLVLSPADGTLLHQVPLPLPVLRDPLILDLDADGEDELLLLAQRDVNQTSLLAVSPASERVLWTQPLAALFGYEVQESLRAHWPIVADLNRDGRPELLVPATAAATRIATVDGPHWNGLDCLRAADGSRLWRRQLGYSHSIHLVPQVEHFLAGPDLNADGTADLLVASLQLKSLRTDGKQLFVDALSGADGHSLWTWHRVVTNRCRPTALTWGQPGADGHPELLLSTILWPWLPADLYRFAPTSGRLLGTTPHAFDPTIADATGDGLPELFLKSAAQNLNAGRNAGTLHSVRGLPPAAWARFANAGATPQPIPDTNGDGIDDLLVANPLSAFSGADGQPLWRSTVDARSWHVLSPPNGDLDHDTVPDILTLQSEETVWGSESLEPVTLLSGKTGRRLWQAALTTQSVGKLHHALPIHSSPERPTDILLVADLALDQPTVQIAGSPTISNQVWMISLSAQDGAVRWKQALTPRFQPGFGPVQLPLAAADLDRDGAQDLVAPVLTQAGTWELQTIRGTDGSIAWRHPLVAGIGLGAYEALRNAPQPVVRDLDYDGQPEVLITDFAPQRDAPRETPTIQATLLVLAGTNGQAKWTWSWSWVEGHRQEPPAAPQPVRSPDGNIHILLLARSPEGPELVCLRPDGQVARRHPLGLRGWQEDFWTADLDANDTDEALWLTDDNQIEVWSGSLESRLWKWPAHRFHSLLPATPSRPTTVVVQYGQELFGLSGPSGIPAWRAYGSPIILDSHLPGTLPSVVSPGPLSTGTGQTWTCRPAMPTDPSGQYQPALRP